MAEDQQPPKRRAGPEKEGAAFAVVMALAAYLGRDNPDFSYPQIAWAFLAFLLFGLVSFTYLAKKLENLRWSLLYVLGNALLISVIVFYSGGSQSYFWVMYLLPVFSATLAFDPRGVMAVTGGAAAVLAVFYFNSFLEHVWPELLELAVKAATLGAAAAVTSRAAQGERQARGLLEEEREAALRERQALYEKLQHMDRLSTMGTLTASITHELNGPIAVILGYAEVISTGMVDAAKLNFCVERIRTSSLRCKQVISDMLDYSRAQKTERKPADINDLVGKCVDLRRYEWSSTGIKVEESYDPSLPRVPLSASEFQQVVFNLLTNAVQAIRSKPDPKGRVKVSTHRNRGHVRVTIEDDGPGIPLSFQSLIWEPFFTTKPAGQGTGLGLSICRRIIEDHQGQLSAESEPGHTVFLIEFPAPQATA